MKKINLKGISEILSEKELKNVMGGSSGYLTCYSDRSNDHVYYAPSVSNAVAWMEVWSALGYGVRCFG